MKARYVMTPPEQRVSQALRSLGLAHEYEPRLSLRYKDGRSSLRYPDFYLPMQDLYIEVRSLDRKYDTQGGRIRKKNRLYKESGVNWIEVDPAYTARDGQRRLKSQRAIERDLTKSIKRYTERRMPGYPIRGLLDDVLEPLAWPSTYRSKRWGGYGRGSKAGRYRSGGRYRGGRGGRYR